MKFEETCTLSLINVALCLAKEGNYNRLKGTMAMCMQDIYIG